MYHKIMFQDLIHNFKMLLIINQLLDRSFHSQNTFLTGEKAGLQILTQRVSVTLHNINLVKSLHKL